MKLFTITILFYSSFLFSIADENNCKDLKTKKQCLKNESCTWLNSKEICKDKNSSSNNNEKNLKLKKNRQKD